jgi:hypothetical protein
MGLLRREGEETCELANEEGVAASKKRVILFAASTGARIGSLGRSPS